MLLQTLRQPYSKKNRFISIIISTLVFCLFFGCSQPFSGQKTSVSFCIDSTIAKQIKAAGLGASSARTAKDDLQNAYFIVSVKGGYEDTKTAEISEQGAVINFENIPVGKRIWAEAEVYIIETNQKIVLFEGKSSTATVRPGTNRLEIKLAKAKSPYNNVTKTSTTYTVVKPLFTNETTGKQLKTNIIEFDHDNNYEHFSWKPEDTDVHITDYQKIKITYKGVSLKPNEENTIAFLTSKFEDKKYFDVQKSVTTESQTYEMKIPQGKGELNFGIENKWDGNIFEFQGDFSFEVEKIELIKDSSLAIDYNASVYIDENPKFLVAYNTSTFNDGNDERIIFRSKEGQGQKFPNGETDSGYASAYWEFDNLMAYDKAAVWIKVDAPQKFDEVRWSLSGYVPYYDNIDADFTTDIHAVNPSFKQIDNLDNGRSDSIVVFVNLSELCTYEDDNGNIKNFKPTTLEFINETYTGIWGPDMEWSDNWDLIIEKIELIRVDENASDLVIFDPNQNNIQNSSSVEITTRDDLNYLKVVPEGRNYTLNIPEVDIDGYLFAKAEVYTNFNDRELEVEMILFNRNSTGASSRPDIEQKTVQFYGAACSTEPVTITGPIGGLQNSNGETVSKVNQLSVCIIDTADNYSSLSGEPVYIGRIIATNNKDLNYDPFKPSSGISASLDIGKDDIVVTRGESPSSPKVTDGSLIEVTNTTEPFVLTIQSIKGITNSDIWDDFYCSWIYDDETVDKWPQEPIPGISIYDNFGYQLLVEPSDLAYGIHDISLTVAINTTQEVFTFTAQIKK